MCTMGHGTSTNMKHFFQGFFLALLLFLGIGAASTVISRFQNIALTGYLAPSGTTNQLTASGTSLLWNAAPLATGTNFWTSDGTSLWPSPQVGILSLTNSAADGDNPYYFDTSIRHTTGNLFQWLNAAESYLTLYTGGTNDFTLLFNSDSMQGNTIGLRVATDGGISEMLLRSSNNVVTALQPAAADGATPYKFDTTLFHTSGNLWEQKNAETNVWALAADAANTYSVSFTSAGTAANAVLLYTGPTTGANSIAIREGSAQIFAADNTGITTPDPGVGGTAAIKIGAIMSCSAITLVVTNYIPVSIGGNTNYVIPLATFTP